MLEKYVSRAYQRILIIPVVKHLSKWRWHPNTITLIACLTGLTIPLALWYGRSACAVILLIVSGYLDSVDGVLARARQCQSELGAALDISSDRLVEFAIVFGLLIIDPSTRAIPAALMLGSILVCVTTFLIVGMFTDNHTQKSFFYDVGLMERAEAFLFFALMIIYPAHFSLLADVFSALVMLTACLRLLSFVKMTAVSEV